MERLNITDKLKATRHRNGWTLTEYYMGESKDGNPKEMSRDYYYGSLGQCLKKSLDIKTGDCTELTELIELIAEFTELTKGIEA